MLSLLLDGLPLPDWVVLLLNKLVRFENWQQQLAVCFMYFGQVWLYGDTNLEQCHFQTVIEMYTCGWSAQSSFLLTINIFPFQFFFLYLFFLSCIYYLVLFIFLFQFVTKLISLCVSLSHGKQFREDDLCDLRERTPSKSLYSMSVYVFDVP